MPTSNPEPLIRNISDTALWVAVYRARESERPDAIFKDPLARRLAGERGEQIAQSTAMGQNVSWPYVARTYQFDQFVLRAVQQGADMVVNLAAGLDTRPYRMALPPNLQWIEVDLPAITDYKEQILAAEKPVCALTRIRLDLADGKARRELFADLGRRGRRALIVTEGLIVYFTREEVLALGKDLAGQPSFQNWALDLGSPGLLKMLMKNLGEGLHEAGSPLKFAPEEGPDFFRQCGWEPVEVRSMLHVAAKLKRLSFGLRLAALFPESNGRQGSRPWGGVCLFKRQQS
jgi:methyltransferase (TIGR00027 family)